MIHSKTEGIKKCQDQKKKKNMEKLQLGKK